MTDRELFQKAFEALEDMMEEFRRYDLPYGSKAYSSAKDARLDLYARLSKRNKIMGKQHTPGPWIIEAETCHTSDIATIHNTAEKWVTIYAPHWMETGMDEHEQSANARLIAAAPDLLEALNSAKDLLHRMGMHSSDAYQQIDAALAKAIGGKE